MKKVQLGRTGLVVSRLCLGTLTLSKLQMNATTAEAREIIGAALDLGVNFYDTAHLYGTYHFIRDIIGKREAVISSRSYAYDYDQMKEDLEYALKETGREWIDVFGLHEQESRLTLIGHRGALEYLSRAKEQGKVRAICVSTHSVEVVREAARIPEVDVLHPLVNHAGIGIRDGDTRDMANAICEASAAGKGIFAMKALAGGHLLEDAYSALCFVRDLQGVDAVAVGAGCVHEVEFNAAVLSGDRPSAELAAKVGSLGRRLHIERWCAGCGACVKVCGQNALRVESGQVRLAEDRCVLCGYCAAACEQFCIKVIACKDDSTTGKRCGAQ